MQSKLYFTSPAPIDPSKRTIVFLHAAFMSSTMWTDQIDYFSKALPNTNLLLIDVNSHGRTTQGREKFTLYDQAEDIISLLVFL
jgi:pimeloyl-ACP methyl ester carboxylesterase